MNDKLTLYNKLRKDYPFFVYESFDYKIIQDYIEISFVFNLSDKFLFKPLCKIPLRDFYFIDKVNNKKLDTIIFNIGLIELISYWKVTCSPIVIIKSCKLSNSQIDWWKNLYYQGLGEFFYTNNIKANFDDFLTFEFENNYNFPTCESILSNEYIIPIGGGKDSIVTLELLKNKYKVRPLIINPRKATKETIEKAGFSEKESMILYRSIDPTLLDLNNKGFLNGHTPFSAMLAFYCILMSELSGYKNIALSNESSANESTVANSDVNHQYSKSYQFESDFREYVSSYICSGYNYFSFLRPLSELQIAALFSEHKNYFDIFKSCNVGSKTDIWCEKCAKCLFVYIILSPFINDNEVHKIWKNNLFEDKDLINEFNELIGITDSKPFECVGTIDEINIALCRTISKYSNQKLPFLLEYFKNTSVFIKYNSLIFNESINRLNAKHHLSKELLNILEKEVGKI